MKADAEGFLYPSADADACISCGMCDRPCPAPSEIDPQNRKSYAVRFTEYEPVSSSGGVFSAVASQILAAGGVVFGAAYDSELGVEHVAVKDAADLGRIRGSKYVQSRIGNACEQVKEALEDGVKVLFSGTPCQVAGLLDYLEKDYDNLLTVDFACHGVPSPEVWARYVTEAGEGLMNVNFRDKTSGWRKYDVAYIYKDRTVRIRHDKDPYMMLYLQNVNMRPSCYDCEFRCGGNRSDLTLSDFWAVSKVLPKMDDGRGVSAVISNTAKGSAALESMKCVAGIEMTEIRSEDALNGNGGFTGRIQVPSGRDAFFAGLDDAGDIRKHISMYVEKKSCIKDMYDRLHSFLAHVKRSILR